MPLWADGSICSAAVVSAKAARKCRAAMPSQPCLQLECACPGLWPDRWPQGIPIALPPLPNMLMQDARRRCRLLQERPKITPCRRVRCECRHCAATIAKSSSQRRVYEVVSVGPRSERNRGFDLCRPILATYLQRQTKHDKHTNTEAKRRTQCRARGFVPRTMAFPPRASRRQICVHETLNKSGLPPPPSALRPSSSMSIHWSPNSRFPALNPDEAAGGCAEAAPASAAPDRRQPGVRKRPASLAVPSPPA